MHSRSRPEAAREGGAAEGAVKYVLGLMIAGTFSDVFGRMMSAVIQSIAPLRS